MPCACQLPPELYPDSSEWGPPLWTVLHALAERAGRGPFPMYHEDERRSLISLFKAIGKMIPCPSCKDHYDSYLRENPTDKDLKDLPYEDIHTYVKRWFWELHNWVNESYNKPLFDYDQLTPVYGRTNIRQTLKDLDTPMTRAIRVRGANLLAYKEFLRVVSILLSYYGV
jgi:hypothetical protein